MPINERDKEQTGAIPTRAPNTQSVFASYAQKRREEEASAEPAQQPAQQPAQEEQKAISDTGAAKSAPAAETKPTEKVDTKAKAKADFSAYDRVAQAAASGDPNAQEVMMGLASVMGADDPAFKDGRLIFKDTNGNVVMPNLDEFREQGSNMLGLANRLYNFKADAKPQESGGKTTADTNAKATQEEQAKTETEAKDEKKPAAQGQGGTGRSAIPTEEAQYRREIDSLFRRGLIPLSRGEMVNAALSGNASNLRTLSTIDIERSAAPLDRDLTRARIESTRALAASRGGAGGARPNEQWTALEDGGSFLVSEKDSGRPLYVVDREGEYRPYQYANDPQGFRDFIKQLNTQYGIKAGDKVMYHPDMGYRAVVYDPTDGNIGYVPLENYAAARKLVDERIRAAQKAQAPVAANIGTVKHTFDPNTYVDK